MFFARLLVVALVFALGADRLLAQVSVLNESFSEADNSTVKIDAIFAPAARQGTVPFRINIHNRSKKPQTWSIQLTEGAGFRKLSTEISASIEVAAGGEATQELFLPQPPSFAASLYRNLRVRISAPGITFTRNESYRTNQDYPTLALSRVLARRSLNALNEGFEDSGSNEQRFAESFTPEQLPSNWQGFTSLDAMLIDLPSWRSLSQKQQTGILEWVRLGGRLDLFQDANKNPPESALKSLKIPGLNHVGVSDKHARLSLGTIHLNSWNGKQINNSIVDQFSNLPKRASNLENAFGKDWNTGTAFGVKKFNPALILVPLLIFAVTVAPVNLFYFAAKGKRHRLFLTTPVISIAACLIIIAIIFLEDGVGGRGYRVTFADLQTSGQEKQVYITQEQISRTGVIANSGFSSPATITIDPVNLPPSIFNPLSLQSNRKVTYRFLPGRFEGGFFRNRSEQGFLIRSVQSSRARIELADEKSAASEPALISNLPVSITRLFYRDTTGELWMSSGQKTFAPGSEISMTTATGEDFNGWVNQQIEGFSVPLQKRIKQLSKERGRFFGLPTSSFPFAIETHQGIEWESDRTLLTGRVIRPQ